MDRTDLLQERYHSILNEPNVFWVAVSNAENVPDVTRVAGLAPVEDLSTITFYLSEAFGNGLLATLQNQPCLTLLVTCIHTFESYQYKGIYQSIRPCTAEEEERQRWYIEGFADSLKSIGILPVEAARLARLYFQQPSYAITFQVKQIFIQTPQKGAGNMVLNLEATHE
jgi:hypothetical protein